MDNTVNQIKEFLELQPLELQLVYKIYSDSCLNHDKASVTSQKVSDYLSSTYSYNSEVASSITHSLMQIFASKDFHEGLINDPLKIDIDGVVTKAPVPKIQLTLADYQRYMDMVGADAEATLNLKALLLAFVIYYRQHYHRSGWVRYDKKTIFFLAGINKLPVHAQEKLTNRLHTHYDLNMQVVGSNQPIPCFSLSWLQDQLPPGVDNNPILTFGDYTPYGVREMIKKM